MGCGCGKSSTTSAGPSPYANQIKRRQERLEALAQGVAEREAARQTE